VETIRRTDVARALLAAIIAAGAAGSLLAQSPDLGVTADAPRARVQPPPSPFSVLPDAVQSSNFHIPGATPYPAGQFQKMPGGDSASANVSTPTLPPATPIIGGTLPPAIKPAAQPAPAAGGQTWGPGTAPAWRWYGYGGVAQLDAPHAMPANSANQAATPSDEKPAAEVLPPPAGPPAPSSDSSSRRGYPQTMPGVITTVSASMIEPRGPTASLGAPRPAGTYTARAVCDTSVRPTSFTHQETVSPRPIFGTRLPTVRASIERVCAGRSCGLEVIDEGRSQLLVRLKVWRAVDAEYLANAIARLPELAPYQVYFEMKVAR
jgi:hypothetical protein